MFGDPPDPAVNLYPELHVLHAADADEQVAQLLLQAVQTRFVVVVHEGASYVAPVHALVQSGQLEAVFRVVV